ncbi:MAG TPA: AtpZ/AtpI family protein [Bacteroidota bacterium]|nr:AtpZ/AtpI family protein [Bacteroidota bacterium]
MDQRDENRLTDEGAPATMRALAPYLTLGIQLALSIIVFFFLGKWLDGKFDTSPWMMLGGLILGGVGGMIKFITSAMKLAQQQDASDAEGKRQKKV